MSEVRLIDANALKQAFEGTVCIEPMPYAFVKQIIDNAPTVESDIEVATKDAYMQGYTEGWKERFGEPNERMQGEWVEVGDNQPYSKDKLYGCSECGFGGYLLSDTENVNFCPNCGAKMGGEKNETD